MGRGNETYFSYHRNENITSLLSKVIAGDDSKGIITYEPLHEKTYNLDRRHNLLKRRHKLAGKNCDLWHVYDACVLPRLVICTFSTDFKYVGIKRRQIFYSTNN